MAGYSVRDLLIRPEIREYYSTSTYVGIQRRLGSRLTVAVLGEYLRSWRVLNETYCHRPGNASGSKIRISSQQSLAGDGVFHALPGRGLSTYDNAQSEFMVSYLRPVRRNFDDGSGPVQVAYPAKFWFGMEQQTFYNFGGQSKTTLLPVIRLNLF